MPDVDDDDLPELPPLGDEDEEETPDRDELGIGELIDDADAGEDVGLDDSAGIDDEESLFALELPPEEDPSETAEEGVDAIPMEGIDDAAEYGWTEDAARGSDETWEPDEHELPDLRPLGHEDHGEEGVEDEIDLGVRGDDEVPGLPPLPGRSSEGADAEEEEADDLALGEDALIEEAAFSFEEERQQMGRALPPALEPPGCVLEHAGAGEVFAVQLGEPVLVGGRGLFSAMAGGLERLDRDGLEDQDVVSITRAEGVVVVGARLGGVFRSEDDGRTFAPGAGVSEANVAQSFHVHAEAGGARLWGRTGSGGLYRSEDRGRTWAGPLLLKPVVAIATPAEGGVVALCAGKDAPSQLVGSEDGGARWAAVDGPPLPDGGAGELHVAVWGEHVAVASDADRGGPFLSSDGGRSWARVPGLPPTGPMALAREPGGLALYAAHFFEGGDRGVVVRHRPDGGEPGVVIDVAEEAAARGVPAHGDSEGEHRIHALAVRADGDATVLYAATGAGLFRARIDPDALP